MKRLYTLSTILLFICFYGILPKAYAQGNWVWGRAPTGGSGFMDTWPVATDASGNSYGAGVASGGPYTFGTHTIPVSVGSYQSLWVKYDPAGTVLWADGTSAGNTYLFNIAVDPTGNLIVFGSFSSATMKIGSFTLSNTGSGAAYYLAKISPAGTVLWAIADGIAMNGWYYTFSTFMMGTGGVATDAAGNIYISSSFAKKTMKIGSTTYTNTDVSGLTNDIFVAKYTPAGALVWANTVGGGGDDYVFSLAVSSLGDVYVAGDFNSSSMAIGPSVLTKSITNPMCYIARFSGGSGTPLWAQNGIEKKGSFSAGLASDNAGNIYMTGGFEDTTITFGATTITRTFPAASPQLALFLVQYSPANVVTWNKTIGSPHNSLWGFCIGLASCGQVWVSGNYTEEAIIESDTLAAITTGDPVFIAGYDLYGGVVGYKGLGGGGDDQNGIACDSKGNVFLCSDYFATLNVGSDVLPGGLGSETFYMAKYAPDPPDTAFTVKDTAACGGITSVTLKGRPGYTYLWDDGSTSPTRSVTVSGKYYVRCTNCAGSLFIDTTNLVITTSKPPVYKSVDTTVCTPFTSITFNASTGYADHVWTTGSTASSISVTTPGLYYVSCTSPCGIEVDTFRLHVIVSDTTLKQEFDTICANSTTYTLTAPPGGSSYLWSTGSTASSIGVNVSVPGTAKYFVYDTKKCATVLDTFAVTTIPKPVVSLGPDVPICAGDTLTLTSPQPPGTTYLWSTGSTANTIQLTTAGAYSVVIKYPNGCTNEDTVNISVTPLPVVDLGPDYFTCNGDAYIMRSGISYTAPAFLWNDATILATDTAKVSGQYWLQVTDNGCKGSDTIKTTIIFDTLNFYNHDTSICRGKFVPTFVTGNSAQTYQWLPTAGIAASTTINPVIVPDTSATYTLTTSMDLCPDRIDSFHIDVQPNPTVYIGDNRMVCEFDSVRIIAAVQPRWYKHYSYSWSPATSLDNTNTSAVTFTPGSYAQLFLTVSTPAGCSAKDSAEMIVHPGNFAAMPTAYNICPRDSVQFKPTGGVAYEWHPGIYLSDSLGIAPWSKTITSQKYTVIATSVFGCRDTLSTSVTVRPGAVIYLNNNTVTLYPGESYHIAPQTNCTKFSWFPSTGLDNAYATDPIAKPEVNTMYIVHAATEWGCKISDSIDILVNPETAITLPNAFTPGTGPNSNFTIIKKGIATLKYFRIFNRWGNKVFETTDIDQGWDGTYKGVPQPFGVFVYEVGAITLTGREFEKHGNVTLIR